ncbi:MAG: DNA polymerase III subunit alpha, partial [Gemmatimonadota bacterium]
SSLATDKLRAMRCDCFEDLIATNALIRPGPLDSGMTDVFIRRKLGKDMVRYPHPDLKAALEPTYGVITYQEQVMRIAQVLAGFTLAEADVMRKAVGKKDAELIQKELKKFVERAVERGVEKRIATELAEQIETFGRYGFNRAHSVAYALISYQTAWLKSHYPAEFMAGLLSSVVDKTDDVVKYIAECRDLARSVPGLNEGVNVLPPDVNESGWKFTPVSDTEIRFGLGALRGVGEAAVRAILDARRDGPFESLFDLVERVDLRAVGKRTLEALIQAGACDTFGHRAQLMAGLELAVGEAQLRQAERDTGQASLFDAGADEPALRPPPQLPDVPGWPESERLAREKEILGFFISGHPLDKFRDEMSVFAGLNTASLVEHRDQRIELPCVVTAVSRQISKRNGAEWGRVTVEDFHGTATVLAFGEVWEANRDVLMQDAPVLVRGQVSGRDRDEDDPPIFLDEVVPLASVRENGGLGLEVRLHNGEGALDRIASATAMFRGHPGSAPLFVVWEAANAEGGPERTRLRSRSLNVALSDDVLAELRELFGRDGVRLVKV